MHTAAQIATGGREQVLENGADVGNSDSDSENEEHGEILAGVCTDDVPRDEKGQPILAKCQLTSTQVEIVRLAAQLKSRPSSDFSSPTSESSSADSEDSVDEFYRCNPQVPKFSELVRIRKPTEDEKALIAQMVKDSRERFRWPHGHLMLLPRGRSPQRWRSPRTRRPRRVPERKLLRSFP
jgi:hypothetical protein